MYVCAHNVIVMVVGNVISNPYSNPGRGCLLFKYH